MFLRNMADKRYSIKRENNGKIDFLIKDSYYGDGFWQTQEELNWDLLFVEPQSAKKSFKQLLRWIKMSENDNLSLVEIKKQKNSDKLIVSDDILKIEVPNEKRFSERIIEEYFILTLKNNEKCNII